MKKIIGIVVEYNPFHNGHLYQINKIKEKYKDSLIIVCMSSSFTQRADASILNKWDKTKVALENNVDIVIELPYIYSTQSSDIFASKAVQLLNHLKINTLCFGSETENIDDIVNSAKIQLNNKDFDNKVKEYLDLGINYPTALNNALKDLNAKEINTPNDLLGVSYIKEILKNNLNIEIFNIKRTNDFHDITSNDDVISASNIRNKLQNKQDIKNNVPQNVYELLKNKNIEIDEFKYLKYKIITEDNLDKYVDVDEGISSRIKKSLEKSNNKEELIQNIKTKRYTYNKICRMLNHILCSFTKEENNQTKNLEYIRILGFTEQGKQYLNEIKNDIKLPILNKYDTKKYSLIYEDILKQEIQNKPIYKKTEI